MMVVPSLKTGLYYNSTFMDKSIHCMRRYIKLKRNTPLKLECVCKQLINERMSRMSTISKLTLRNISGQSSKDRFLA